MRRTISSAQFRTLGRYGQLVSVAPLMSLSVSKTTPTVGATDWRSVNRPEQQVTIDAGSCCVPLSPKNINAIDAFYESIGEVLRLGSPAELAGSDALGRLLTLGIVTVTETYFRSVITAVVKLCPLAHECASDQQIAYGALDFYGTAEISLSLLEGISFAGDSEIAKATKKILGFDTTVNRSLTAALEAYNKVCTMRHAVVHDHGRLNRGNARTLKVHPGSGRSLCVVVDFPGLQTAASACTSAVRAYNAFLWESVVLRWIKFRLLTGNWRTDKKLFEPMFKTFSSTVDATGPANMYIAYLSIRPDIVARLASPT